MSTSSDFHKVKAHVKFILDAYDAEPRTIRPDLVNLLRYLEEICADFTPVRPASRSDMRAVRDTVETFSADRVMDILKEGRGE